MPWTHEVCLPTPCGDGPRTYFAQVRRTIRRQMAMCLLLVAQQNTFGAESSLPLFGACPSLPSILAEACAVQ